MTAEISGLVTLSPTLQVLAQAYGTSTYSSNSYNGGTTTTAPAPASPIPLPPNTGFLMQSPLIDIPLLLILAVIVGSISFTISRKLRRRKRP